MLCVHWMGLDKENGPTSDMAGGLVGKPVLLSWNTAILSRVSFSMNYCISVPWHGGDQPVSLLRHYCRTAFSSTVLPCQVFLIFILMVPTVKGSLWGSGQARWLVNEA